MHWLRPYVIKEITDCGGVQFVKLNGEPFLGKVNESRLKLYTRDPTPVLWLYGSRTISVIQEASRDCRTINYSAQLRKNISRHATWQITGVWWVKLRYISCAMENDVMQVGPKIIVEVTIHDFIAKKWLRGVGRHYLWRKFVKISR